MKNTNRFGGGKKDRGEDGPTYYENEEIKK